MRTNEKIRDKRSKIKLLDVPHAVWIKRDFDFIGYLSEERKVKFVLSDSFKEYLLSTPVVVGRGSEIPKKFGLMTREEIILRIFSFFKNYQDAEIKETILVGSLFCVDGVIRVVSLEKFNNECFFHCSSLSLWLDRLDIIFRKKEK